MIILILIFKIDIIQTWIMERYQDVVVEYFLTSGNRRGQDFSSSLNDLPQVIVHGASYVEHESHGNSAMRDRCQFKKFFSSIEVCRVVN